jgi:hypothetical protein
MNKTKSRGNGEREKKEEEKERSFLYLEVASVRRKSCRRFWLRIEEKGEALKNCEDNGRSCPLYRAGAQALLSCFPGARSDGQTLVQLCYLCPQ